jgi:hypothetical protein
MAPFELTLFSFLDAQGVEQDFTTTDPKVAREYAARNNLVLMRNTYEFVNSQPVADFSGSSTVIASD